MRLIKSIKPYGEQALLLILNDQTTPDTIHSLDQQIRKIHHTIEYTIPASNSILIGFDSYLMKHETLISKIIKLETTDKIRYDFNKHNLGISFLPKFALDLENVCKQIQTTKSQMIQDLLSSIYQVQFKGFLPGFAYLGTLAEHLQIPRKMNPRKKVVAGSVAIAGSQIAIYPIDSPGGWNIIGHCKIPMIKKQNNDTGLLRVCDTVCFHEIKE